MSLTVRIHHTAVPLCVCAYNLKVSQGTPKAAAPCENLSRPKRFVPIRQLHKNSKTASSSVYRVTLIMCPASGPRCNLGEGSDTYLPVSRRGGGRGGGEWMWVVGCWMYNLCANNTPALERPAGRLLHRIKRRHRR